MSLSPDTRHLLLTLLTQERVLSLAVVAEGEPVVGLLPFVWSADGGALLIQASGLARHARGLLPGALFDVLVHSPDDPQGDAMQVPRLTLQGRCGGSNEDRWSTPPPRRLTPVASRPQR